MILLCVRWYLRYALSYRDLEEMMLERGLHVDHSTIFRWGKSLRAGIGETLPSSCGSPRPTRGGLMRTYMKVKKEWVYLYRAVD